MKDQMSTSEHSDLEAHAILQMGNNALRLRAQRVRDRQAAYHAAVDRHQHRCLSFLRIVYIRSGSYIYGEMLIYQRSVPYRMSGQKGYVYYAAPHAGVGPCRWTANPPCDIHTQLSFARNCFDHEPGMRSTRRDFM